MSETRAANNAANPITVEYAESPTTTTGKALAAFLRGLLPETTQFDRQIAAIEQEAATAGRLHVYEADVACDSCGAINHVELHQRLRGDSA